MHATIVAVKQKEKVINFRLTIWKNQSMYKQSQTMDLLSLLFKVQCDKNIEFLQLDQTTLQHITCLPRIKEC